MDPETSANAQANYGGGWRRPASADHLIRSKLPKETLYGIKGNVKWVHYVGKPSELCQAIQS